MSFHKQESVIQQSLTKSHLRYLSPVERGSQIQRETILNPQLRESQFILSNTPRETVIPLDVQYTVTKKVDQQNYSDYEVRIQSLQHEVELWRKRYLDMMANYDRNIANEEVIKLQDAKIQLLNGENQDLYQQIRALIKDNDELQLRINNYELNNSTEETQRNYENLQVQLKSRLSELDEWRSKYSDLESQFNQFKGLEINNIQVEGQLKGLEGQLQLWQERYWGMVDERNNLQSQIFELNEKLNAVQIEAAQRNNATELKLKDAEILRLKNLIQYSNEEIDNWRKKTLQMETEVQLKQQDVDAQKVKVSKQLEQINNLDMAVLQKGKFIDEQSLQITQLENQLLEINALNQEIDNLNEMLSKKDSNISDLRKEISRLENNCGELRHEKLLKLEFEADNKRLVETVEQFKQLASDRKSQLDALRIKYGNLEIEKNQIQQRFEETKYLTTQIKQLENENKSLIRRVKYLEDQVEANKIEIQELQARIQQLKLFEIENKKANELIILKDNEIQNLRRKLTQFELQPKSKDTSELELRIKTLLQTIEQLQSQFAQTQEQLDKANKQNMLLSQSIVSLEITQETHIEDRTEINQWSVKSNQMRSELDLLQKHNQELQTNCDFLNDQLRLLQKQLISRRQEVEDWRRQAGAHYVDATEAKKQLKEVEALQAQLVSENGKLVQELKQLKNQLVEESNEAQKIQLQSVEQQLQAQGTINQLNQDVSYLKIQLQIKTDDAEDQRRRYLQSEQLNHDLKGIEEKYTFTNAQLTQVKSDNERLNQQLREQSQQQVQTSPQNNSDSLIQQLQQLQTKYDKLQQEYINTATQIPLLKQELADRDLTPLQKRIDELLKELQKVTLAFQNKVRECEELRSRCNVQESRITDLRYLEKRVPELQGQNRQLQQQIDDQLNEMTLLNGEIDKLNQKVAKYQLQLKNYQILQNDFATLQSVCNAKDQDIAKLKTSNYLVGTDLENTQKIKQEYVDKYEKVCTEREEIRANVSQLQLQIDRLNNRLGKAEVKALEAERLSQKLKVVEGQLGQAQEDNVSLTQQKQQFQAQVQALQTQNANQEFKINSLIPFRNQWEDLQDIISRDQQSLSSLQVQLAQALEQANQNLRDLQQAQEQLKNKELQIEDRSRVIVELEQVNEQNVSHLNQLQKANNEVQEENFQLKVTNQNAIFRLKKLEAIESDYNKLIEQNQQLTDQLNLVSDKLKVKEAEAAQFQYWKESLESRVALLASEIERQKHMVKTKNDDIDNLKEANARLETLVTQLSTFEGDARRSEEQILQLKGQIENVKQNLVIKQKECEELRQLRDNAESKATSLGQDVDNLKSSQLALKVKQEDLIQEVQRLQNECTQLKTFSGVQNELEAKIQSLSGQQEQLQQQLQSKNRELVDLKQKLNDADSQAQVIKQLQVEEQKLQLQIVTQNKEKEEWHAKIDALQRQIEKLEKLKTDLENKCALLAGQIELQLQKYRLSQAENQKMNDQIVMLSDDNDRLTQSLQNALAEGDELRKKVQPLQTSFMQQTVIKSQVSVK